jgi:hypothetical protein
MLTGPSLFLFPSFFPAGCPVFEHFPQPPLASSLSVITFGKAVEKSKIFRSFNIFICGKLFWNEPDHCGSFSAKEAQWTSTN